MNRDLISRTEQFLKQKFDDSPYMKAHPEDKAYRLEHSYRVANIGRKIALQEGFDETEMVIAGLLHDVSYCEVFGENGWKNHGRRAAQIARPFLEELGLPSDRINDICYGIAIHVDDEADFEGERTPFALSVGDADNIDRFDAYRIYETLEMDHFSEKNLEEKRQIVNQRLERMGKFPYDMLGTKTAKEICEERLGFYKEFLDKLKSQLDNSAEINE
ncbi:MAG: HD domain-containing protein [Lachnospiraceae bacterium]|nr:HD domain-containing protein [Lachnospiraceae bacterium]